MKLEIKSKVLSNAQRGFTLIELMVSMVIGLIILAGVIGMFVSMVKSDNDYLKSVRLNQELRAAMSLITRDIRRAGANRTAATDSPANPFSVAGGTRLTIAANQQGVLISCLTYSYDANDTSNELFGYRHDSTTGSVETRADGAACNANGWSTITDDNLVDITALTFVDTTVTEVGINIRQITVTLSGRLRRDNTVIRALTETVRLRNDEV